MSKIIPLKPKDPKAPVKQMLKDLIDNLTELEVSQFFILARTNDEDAHWHSAQHGLTASFWGGVEMEKHAFFTKQILDELDE